MTTSIRERRAIRTQGELNIVVSAKQGWMPNPAINSVVANLAASFARFTQKVEGPIDAHRVFADGDWSSALSSLSVVKTVGISFDKSNNMCAEVRFTQPMVRIPSPGVDPLDYTATFKCEWIPYRE